MKDMYTIDEMADVLQVMRGVFDIARVVDPIQCMEYDYIKNSPPTTQPSACFCVWNRPERCGNCVSMSALQEKTRKTKYDYVDQDIYHVTSKYITVSGEDRVLELVNKISDEVLLGGVGNTQFMDHILHFNRLLYTDPLTGAYNRKYLANRPFSPGCTGTHTNCSVAMIDIDNFKSINDTYGHIAGDEVLRALAGLLSANISERRGDIVVRYGGDEFVLLFNSIPQYKLISRLNSIVEKAPGISFSQYPDLSFTLSIGGAMQSEHPDAPLAQLIDIADKRMYFVKNRGGGRANMRQEGDKSPTP